MYVPRVCAKNISGLKKCFLFVKTVVDHFCKKFFRISMGTYLESVMCSSRTPVRRTSGFSGLHFFVWGGAQVGATA